MNPSIPISKKTSKRGNDSVGKRGLSDCEIAACSDVSSVYEINVHENFGSESGNNTGNSNLLILPKLIVKVRKIGGNNEGKENVHNAQLFVENIKKIANPLIESYYPFLENQQIENVTIEVNVIPGNSDGKGNAKKSFDEKNDENSKINLWKKSNERMTSDSQETEDSKKLVLNRFNKIRKKIRRQIVQDIKAKKGSEFKDVPWKDVLEDQLHIHHHEHHHHHYYVDSRKKDKSEFTLLRNGSRSPVHWSEDKKNDFRRTEKSNCNLSNLTYVKRSKEEYMQIAEKCSSRTLTFKPFKRATSMDSLSNKKSDLIAFHNYSDTEVSNRDSEESSLTDVHSSRSAININQNMKKSPKTEYKKSKLGGERDFLTESFMQEDNSNCSVSDSEKEILNFFSRLESMLSSESKPAKTQTSGEIVKPTSTIATSTNDTDTLFKALDTGSWKSGEKCSRNPSPKRAGHIGDKVRNSSGRKMDFNDQVRLNSRQIFGMSGNSNSKGVVHYFYSSDRNRKCNITLSFEKKRAIESSKLSDNSKKRGRRY